MLTQERAEIIGKYLTSDPERANRILSLSPENAVKEFSKEGYDFSVEEITEFGENLKAAAEKGELNEGELENVSGGMILAASATFYFTVFAGCAVLGAAAATNWKW